MDNKTKIKIKRKYMRLWRITVIVYRYQLAHYILYGNKFFDKFQNNTWIDPLIEKPETKAELPEGKSPFEAFIDIIKEKAEK
jgi:hypothetical protein